MHNENERISPNVGNTIQVAMMFISAWAITVLLPFRRCIGARYLFLHLPFAAGMAFLYGVATHQDAVLIVIPFYLVGMVMQAGSRARHGGDYCHSQYSGLPYITMKLFRITDEQKAKKFAEPLVAAMCGCYLLLLSPAIGMYWIGGAWAALMTFRMHEYQYQQVQRQLRDSMLESQHFAEMARGLRRGLRHH